MSKKTKADRKPTWVSLTLDALVRADDFMSVDMIRVAIGAENNNVVSASLHHLQKRHAADAVEVSGRLWWFATPATDDRERVVGERVREPKGNRTRKPRVTKASQS